MFSLVNSGYEETQNSVADFVCRDAAIYSEWMEGLSFLITGEMQCTNYTINLMSLITDAEIKSRLMDLEQEKVGEWIVEMEKQAGVTNAGFITPLVPSELPDEDYWYQEVVYT